MWLKRLPAEPMLGARAKGVESCRTDGALGLGSSLRILAPARFSKRCGGEAKWTFSDGAGIWLKRLLVGPTLGALVKGAEQCSADGALGLGSSFLILTPARLSERWGGDATWISSVCAGMWLNRLLVGWILGALAKGAGPCRTNGALSLAFSKSCA